MYIFAHLPLFPHSIVSSSFSFIGFERSFVLSHRCERAFDEDFHDLVHDFLLPSSRFHRLLTLYIRYTLLSCICRYILELSSLVVEAVEVREMNKKCDVPYMQRSLVLFFLFRLFRFLLFYPIVGLLLGR